MDWRAFWISVAAALITLVFVGLLIFMPHTTSRNLNCGIAEISPDVTPQEREACRQLRAIKS